MSSGMTGCDRVLVKKRLRESKALKRLRVTTSNHSSGWNLVK